MTPLEAWYYEIPIITRTFLTAVFFTTLALQLHLVHPLQLHFSFDLIFRSGQYWRLLTSFLYFGEFSVDFLFHMFFLQRYARMLEEGSFRGRTADFFWLFLLGGTAFVLITPLVTTKWTTMPFLSSPLTFMLVYIWSRRNPHVRMSFLGIFNFTAPFLPWVLLAFTMLMNGVWPTGDLLGMGVGHVYYFLDDVWPRTGGGNRPRLLRAPEIVKGLFEGRDANGVTDDRLRNLYEEQGQQQQVLGGGADDQPVSAGAAASAGASASSDEVGGSGVVVEGNTASEAWTLVEDEDKTTTVTSSPAQSLRSRPSDMGLRDRSGVAAGFANAATASGGGDQ
ncbi:Derlin-2 [Phlyctochytrium planicorne]|nr:Derlin-2 [Phlyctochytrium planicorne]